MATLGEGMRPAFWISVSAFLFWFLALVIARGIGSVRARREVRKLREEGDGYGSPVMKLVGLLILIATLGVAHADDARKACTDAMNADPTFAKAIRQEVCRQRRPRSVASMRARRSTSMPRHTSQKTRST